MWSRIRDTAKVAFEVVKAAAESFGDDRGSRMASAVAYRTMFALAPLILIGVFALGLVVGDDASARTQILAEVGRFAGERVSGALETFLMSVARSGDTAGLVGFGLLLWTGSSLFLELQQDLNDIFGIPTDRLSGVWRTVRQRLIGFGWALSVGLVLIVIWLLNSVWRYLGDLVPESFEAAHRVITVLAPVVSLILLPVVFALSYQTLSRLDVAWRAVWWGSIFTTIAFLAVSYGAGFYFQFTGDDAAGIAGSIVLVVLLAFVLSSVFLFGAEVIETLDRYWKTGEAAPRPKPEPEAVVSTPGPPVPVSAVFAFLAGLAVAWRRRE